MRAECEKQEGLAESSSSCLGSLYRGRVRQRRQCSQLASLLTVSATEETETEKKENYHGHSQTSVSRLRHVNLQILPQLVEFYYY